MCGMGQMAPGQSFAEVFWTFVGILVVSSNAGSALVLAFALCLPSQDLAFSLGSGVATIGMAMSGGFVPFPWMPDHASWLQWASPCKYTFQALCVAQFEGSALEYILDETELLEPSTVAANLGVLIAVFVCLTTIAGVALAKQREVR